MEGIGEKEWASEIGWEEMDRREQANGNGQGGMGRKQWAREKT